MLRIVDKGTVPLSDILLASPDFVLRLTTSNRPRCQTGSSCISAVPQIHFKEAQAYGAKANDGSFIGTEKLLADGEFLRLLLGTNTTIGCILTDAKIDKVEANKLASISHNGLARAIRPVHTDYDGDTMFCMSCGKKPVVNFAVLESAIVKATEQAIINAVSLTKEYDIEFDEEE